MKFGLWHLVILDDGVPFKGAFIDMYQALNLNNNILAKKNHKELIVECVHPFLNKNIPIADEERGTNDIFVPTNIAVDYA